MYICMCTYSNIYLIYYLSIYLSKYLSINQIWHSPKRFRVWETLSWHTALLCHTPNSPSLFHLCLSCSASFPPLTFLSLFFLCQKAFLFLQSVFPVQTPSKAGYVTNSSFCRETACLNLQPDSVPFCGLGWWMVAIMASVLPLEPHQPQVPQLSMGLVSYGVAQWWGKSHGGGPGNWVSGGRGCQDPAYSRDLFCLVPSLRPFTSDVLTWTFGSTSYPCQGTHRLGAPSLSLGVWVLETDCLDSAPGPAIC
jgi:hypothetical protein